MESRSESIKESIKHKDLIIIIYIYISVMGSNSANYNLEKYITKIDDNYNPKSIHLCIYKINNNPKPFIQYLLYKYHENKLLTFPIITNINSKIDSVINIFLDNIFKNVKEINGYHV